MSTTVREAFERGTETFNAHDLDGFAAVLADDVTFKAPGGLRGDGKDACLAFFGGWLAAFPDARVEVHASHVAGDVVVEEAPSPAPTTACCTPRPATSRRPDAR